MTHYKYHCKNLQLIETGINTVARTIRDHIRAEKFDKVDIYTKILGLLINTWSELRVLKLIHEYNAFTNDEIKLIINKKSLRERWETSLEIAIRKAYSIPNTDRIINIETPFTLKARYSALIDIIDNELLLSSQIRNRIAHGQWYYVFNDDLNALNEKLTKELKTDNIYKLKIRLKMFRSMAQIIHDLAVSKDTFERDFDINYRAIEIQREEYRIHDYNKYVNRLVVRNKRGLAKKKEYAGNK